MPVQDEFKLKNDVKQPENNIQKAQKLMPFLNVKAENHQSKINSIDVKIATKEDKISRNEARIERLTAKADRLEDRNTMLKNMFGNVPAVRKIIELNEKKIENIRNVKIPKRQEKIKFHKQKIAVLSEKRDKIKHKLNRVIALNDAVKSFSISLNSERREIFSDAMNRLNTANADCLSDKITALQAKKQQIIEEYNRPETSVVDKVNLNQKLKSINNKIHNTNEKMQKYIRSENSFSEKSADVVDATMKVTSDKFADISESATYTIPEITENIISAADSVELMDKNKIAEIATDFNSLDGSSRTELENMQYSWKEHDSLQIKDNEPGERGQWFRFSTDEGGDNISFVREYMGKSFIEAVEMLNGEVYVRDFVPSYNYERKPKKVQKSDISIAENTDCKRVFAYLCKTRGLDYNMVSKLVKSGKIVQEQKTGNAVFKVTDENNTVIGAEKVGTYTQKKFKGIATGSASGYGFEVCKGNGENLLFFESSIDLLSYLQMKNPDNCRLVSMMGVKPNTVIETMKRHGISPENVFICSDNDNAGNEFFQRLQTEFPQINRIKPDENFKDWNDMLRKIPMQKETEKMVVYGNKIWNDATDNRDKTLVSMGENEFEKVRNLLNNSGMNYFAYAKSGTVVMAVNDKDIDWLKQISGNENLFTKKSDVSYIPPQKNIIGNAEYRYIPDKNFISCDRDTALKTAEIMAKNNIQFSGRIYPSGKATLTVSGANFADVQAIQQSVIDMRKQFAKVEKAGEIIGNKAYRDIQNKHFYYSKLSPEQYQKIKMFIDTNIHYSGLIRNGKVTFTVEKEDSAMFLRALENAQREVGIIEKLQENGLDNEKINRLSAIIHRFAVDDIRESLDNFFTPNLDENQFSKMISLVNDYLSQSVSERYGEFSGLNKILDFKNEIDRNSELNEFFSEHNFSDEQKLAISEMFAVDDSVVRLNVIDESFLPEEIYDYYDILHNHLEASDVTIFLENRREIAVEREKKTEFTSKEKAFLNGDIMSFMVKSALENRLNENEISEFFERMQNGEDIRKDLAVGLLGGQRNFITTHNNEFTAEYGENSIIARYGNVERNISYEDLGDEFLKLITPEYSDISENHEVKNSEESPIHFGLFGNGITAYDISRTDKETDDYVTVAHISPEGVVKVYDDSISADDMAKINDEARSVREKFLTDWKKLDTISQFQKLYDRANTETMLNISKENLSTEEKIAKYMSFVFFGEGERPEPVTEKIPDDEIAEHDVESLQKNEDEEQKQALISQIDELYNETFSDDELENSTISELQEMIDVMEISGDNVDDDVEIDNEKDDIDAPLFADAEVIEEIEKSENSTDNKPFWETPDVQGEQLSLFGDSVPLVTKEMPKQDKEIFADGLFVGNVNRFTALHNEIMRGTGFQDGKLRVKQFYDEKKPTNKEFADFLKHEYGIGGHSGDGEIRFVDHDSKGMFFTLDSGEKFKFTWSDVAEMTASIIEKGEYIEQKEKSEISDNILTHNKDISVYKGEWKIADNKELYKDIVTENKQFAEMAKSVIGNGKNPADSVKALTEKFGFERTAWLTALNIVAHPLDDRFYPTDKEWACKVLAPHFEIKPDELFRQDTEKRSTFDRLISGGTLYDIHNTHLAQFAETFIPEYEKYLEKAVSVEKTEVSDKKPTVSSNFPTHDKNIHTFSDKDKQFLADYPQIPVPAYSPWGAVQECTEIAHGAFEVSTAGHGGIMIADDLVEHILSDKAREIGFIEDGWHCFEEDADAQIPLREMFDKGIMDKEKYFAEKYNSTFEETGKFFNNVINNLISTFHPDYWSAYTAEQISKNSDNFTITDNSLGNGGAKAKFRANIDAIKTLKTLEKGNRPATAEEKETLSKYVGWGGIPQAFDKENKSWESEYSQLKELLTDKEYSSARASVLDAFFTSPTVIDGIYEALENFGFEGGNVLEPSCGVGNFFGKMPDEMRENSKLYGVEIDDISGRIAKQIYPDADISIKGFEKNTFQNDCFDVAVGNVPFGELSFKDDKHKTSNVRYP